ncbi:MAG: hypothetical protein U5K69_25245 [Balneolaceae bacterium]|nr:hypothetical protein [Balneolaceae bacterium]
MKNCLYRTKHLDNVFSKGYPIFIVTIFDHKQKNNKLIELIRLFANYNSEKYEFTYKYAPINSKPVTDKDIEVIFDWGFDYLKQELADEILETESDLQSKALPLKELDFSHDLFDKLKTSPSFEIIKSKIVEKSGCAKLKKNIQSYDMIKFEIK